jgi:hypothetical protein
MLFGHLSAEDFTNLLEGTSVPESRRVHLQSCDRCRQRFAATQEMRSQIEAMTTQNDEYIPEPEWSEFRSDVRNALLSRSVKRESASRSWIGAFGLKPVFGVGMASLLVAAFVISGLRGTNPIADKPTTVAEDSATEEVDLNSLDAVARTDVFEEILRLNADEADSLQMILDEGVSQQ